MFHKRIDQHEISNYTTNNNLVIDEEGKALNDDFEMSDFETKLGRILTDL
jgi:hypothetical protein